MPRIYQPVPLVTDQIISLNENASHHLVRVLRLKEGAPLIVFNGEGGEFSAQLLTVKKNYVTVRIGDFCNQLVESPLQIHLGQGISRGERMDYTIQKAVELGVTEITPLITERCEVRLSEERFAKRVQHWQGIATAACEQSGRHKHVKIATPEPLLVWMLKQQEQSILAFVLHHRTSKKLTEYQQIPKKIALLIGPEGGLSDAEITLAQKYKFHPLQLGPRILRTETAALVAITALQYRWGDMMS